MEKEKFLTGHEIFDKIVDIYYGSALLVLDGGYGEALHFLMNLIKTQRPMRLIFEWNRSPTKEVVFITPLTLNDISITINELRRSAQESVLIHEYLADLLIKYEHEVILKLLETWKYEIRNNRTIEFYLLPKGTFPEMEKKILAIFDGGLEVRKLQTKRLDVCEFIPIKCCHPEWNLRPVKYEYKDNRVLIEWYGEMTDRLIQLSPELVDERIRYYERNLTGLKLKISHKELTKPLTEYLWFFSHFDDKTLLNIKLLFPESFNDLLKKIAVWELQGYLRVVEVEEKPIKNIKQIKKEQISFKTKLALNMPSWLFFRILGIKEGARIPGSIYNRERKLMFEFLKNMFGYTEAEYKEAIEKFLKIKEEFHQIIGRQRALEAIQEIGENPLIKLDMKYVSKIMKLTLYFGFRLKCDVETVNNNVFRVRVPDCFLCKDTSSEIPICSAITGALSGAASVIFKEPAYAKEIKCKATGHDECVFELKIG
ncbi:MAG: 4-vinyl reductase [Nitrososphaerota archaeon]